jgi:hypothetical protein
MTLNTTQTQYFYTKQSQPSQNVSESVLYSPEHGAGDTGTANVLADTVFNSVQQRFKFNISLSEPNIVSTYGRAQLSTIELLFTYPCQDASPF